MRTLSRVTVSLVALFAASRADASFINYSAREINVKIIYAGPASAGLRENLDYIYAKTNPEAKGKMLDLATEPDGHVVFFDFLPLALGDIRGFKVRFHLYTAVSKSIATRRLVLKGADAVIFVADCDPAAAQATVAAWKELHASIVAQGYDPATVPITVQLDHRDLPNATSVESMRKLLGLEAQPTVEAVSSKGIGVLDSLKSSAKQVLTQLKNTAPPAKN